jgi:phosphate transport system protein
MPESNAPKLATHISSEYDEKLARAHDLVMQMAERARRQVDDAIECLRSASFALVDQVLRHELTINALERAVDALVEQIIARRQPAASDLRLLTTIFKVTTDLERIGDEAKKIALQARRIHGDSLRKFPRSAGIQRMCELARGMLREAVDRLERMDAEGADAVVRRDTDLDEVYRGVLRELVSFMIEDPRTISARLDMTAIVRSLERIGDHAKNIAGHVIYARKGTNVRHLSAEEVELAMRS